MITKYIFVTGGVVSGLGKGITAASLGLILGTNGFSVDAIKLDPYLNVDPGTMSPFEHGEVFVLADGSECDLDLGHYERFLDINLTGSSSVSAGQIYDTILKKEREGDYLGKTVQLIPNVSNYILEIFQKNLPKTNLPHIRMIEIGGSTGDMESDIFMESLRQFKQKNRENVFHIHLGYIPFLACSGEYKSKPIQSSLKELLRQGLQPDCIVARYTIEKNDDLPQVMLDKIALFSNLDPKNIVKMPDLTTIYAVPDYLMRGNMPLVLQNFVNKKITHNLPEFWSKHTPQEIRIDIALVTKYTKLSDSYLSVFESLKIAGMNQNVKANVIMIDGEKLEQEDKETWNLLKSCKAIVVPGGFGGRAIKGKIMAIKYARENKIPFLGICLGMQLAVIEFAQNVCGLNVTSREILEAYPDTICDGFVVDYMHGQSFNKAKGGTMRLGNYECVLQKGSKIAKVFGVEKTTERHRHRLEVQNQFVPTLEKNGLVVSGKFELKNQDYLVEMIELKDHPYFVATQSHPEFLSRPTKAHPLFAGLITASLS